MNGTTGFLSLCLVLAAHSRNPLLLRETLIDIGLSLTERESKWAFRNANLDLPQGDRDWLQGNMLKIYHASCNMPYTAYLWKRQEAESLNSVVSFKVSDGERERLDAIATTRGISRGELMRQVCRDWLNQTDQPGLGKRREDS